MLIRQIPLMAFLCTAGILAAQGAISRDVMSDTWVATDGEGRRLPTAEEVGKPRKDRTVALFYFLTFLPHEREPDRMGPYDMAKILAQDPKAVESNSPLLGPVCATHYWAEPLLGYYCNADPAVIRKHAQMLGDAGVDVLVFDVSNGPTLDPAWRAVLDGFSAVRAQGGHTPQIAFMCPFPKTPPRGSEGKGLRHLWETLYRPGLHSDLWFRWEGKPLVIAHPTYCGPEEVAFGDTEGVGRYAARLEKGHTLGQRVTSPKGFSSVEISVPTFGAHAGCAVTLRLRRDEAKGEILAERRYTDVADNDTLRLELPTPLSAGTYVIELSDPDVAMGWWSSKPVPGKSLSGALADGKEVSGFRDFTLRAAPTEEERRMREFFTFRRPVAGYHQKDPMKGGWSWLEVYPQHVYQDFEGRDEMMSVGVAQNANPTRKCAMNEPGAMGRRWHDGANDPDPRQLALGPNFQEQWDHALKVDPRLVFVTGWNEWTAMRFSEWNGWTCPGGVYPDSFNPEFSRDCEPTKIAWGDAYYWQLVANIRRYKGVREVPSVKSAPIRIDRRFEDWKAVSPEFRDTVGDEMKRDYEAMGRAGRYVDASGRNDIVSAKVARDAENLYFYVRTREPLTNPKGAADWMRLFLDTDRSTKTGWLGYDFIVEYVESVGRPSYVLRMHCATDAGWDWSEPLATFPFAGRGNELEVAVPITAFKGRLSDDGFDFKWEDHALQSYDWTDFTLHGDAAPNDRYNYRAVFK